MNKFVDEIVFMSALSISIYILQFLKYLDIYGLWGSLIVLIAGASYYSTTFFKSEYKIQKLYYYLGILPFIIGYFALVYKSFGLIDTSTNEQVTPSWLNSIYFSVVTWTTLGYGDFKPVEPVKIWVIVEALMGYVYMGLLVGKLLFIASSSDTKPKQPNSSDKIL
ncbi:MAG: two pore domain potassium channel family protein [Oceanospirillales bacterium]|nr:two pore domain potassium channel family protein [Oceanospirillales bacterium]MBR9887181.1 two pore domain potassium channel family protein [Oceanospirillales bacterium]